MHLKLKMIKILISDLNSIKMYTTAFVSKYVCITLVVTKAQPQNQVKFIRNT